MRKHMLIRSGILTLALVLAISGISFAEYTNSSVSANVNVNVSPVSVVAISTTNVTLSVNEAQQPVDGEFNGVLDAPAVAGGVLSYSTNESNKKITASLGGTLASGPSGITLNVEASQDGTAAGQVSLASGSSAGADLITGLSTSYGSFDLTYSALVQLSVPAGSYNGSVTYTITDASLL